MQTKTFKTMKEYNKVYNVNNEVNQNIKDKFVRQHVYTCFSYEMEEILEAGIVDYEEIENIYIQKCPNCGTDIDDIIETDDGHVVCSYCDCNLTEEHNIGSIEDIDYEAQEIFEYWIVSEFLYRKLRDKGYPVLEWGNNYYWGRTGTGQAILLDRVISEICFEMEILQGQKYSWEKTI